MRRVKRRANLRASSDNVKLFIVTLTKLKAICATFNIPLSILSAQGVGEERHEAKQSSPKAKTKENRNFVNRKSSVGRLPSARSDGIKITSDSSKCKALNLSSLLYVVNPTVNR